MLVDIVIEQKVEKDTEKDDRRVKARETHHVNEEENDQ